MITSNWKVIILKYKTPRDGVTCCKLEANPLLRDIFVLELLRGTKCVRCITSSSFLWSLHSQSNLLTKAEKTTNSDERTFQSLQWLPYSRFFRSFCMNDGTENKCDAFPSLLFISSCSFLLSPSYHLVQIPLLKVVSFFSLPCFSPQQLLDNRAIVGAADKPDDRCTQSEKQRSNVGQ
jgi:hypothetical protein